MFFDLILLNTQRRGRFGIAWLAATRGVKYVTKKEIKEQDINKLCEDLRLFIISYSTSPKKRFSLRLAAILINGAVKIFREQVIILQGDICFYSITGTRSLISDAGVSDTPPTPIPKVKTKRGKKQVVLETPDLQCKDLEQDIFLTLPNVEDILRPPARTEDISIKEYLLQRPELVEDDFGFGVLSRREAEEEFQSLLSKTKEAPSSHPQYPSSESETPQQGPIEVIAQIHASKDGPLDKDTNLIITTQEKHPDIETDKHATVVPAEIQLVESAHATEHVQHKDQEEQVIRDVIEQPLESAHAPGISSSEKISELQQVQIERMEAQTPRSKILKDKQKDSEKIQLRELVSETPKVFQEKPKLLLNKTRKTYVRINICNENEEQLIEEECPLPVSFKNIGNEYLYEMLWSNNEESIVDIRARDSVRSVSRSDSVGLRLADTHRSTLERETTSDTIRPSVLSMEEPVQESTPLARPVLEDTTVRAIITEEIPEPLMPIGPVSTPRKRRRITGPGEVGAEQQIILEQPSATVHSVSEQLIIPEQPIADLPTVIEQVIATEQILPTSHKVSELEPKEPSADKNAERDRQQFSAPKPSNYKVRQQNIINIVIQWTSNQGITIEDVCEKPINKLNIARTFSDLLSKYDGIYRNALIKFLILK